MLARKLMGQLISFPLGHRTIAFQDAVTRFHSASPEPSVSASLNLSVRAKRPLAFWLTSKGHGKKNFKNHSQLTFTLEHSASAWLG